MVSSPSPSASRHIRDEAGGGPSPQRGEGVSTHHIYTVTELTREIKSLLEREFGAVWVTGEVSNFRASAAGHVYFTLKDAETQIAIVMFRGVHRELKFRIGDGLEMIVYGRLTVYETRGQHQIIAEYIEPKGIGAFQLAFEQLKKKLEEEGLFDPERKKPLPYLPRHIGLVTSPTGAAVRDMIHILARRFPNIEILINPVAVQGEGAAPEIAAAIDEINADHPTDLIIVARGGGSIEDLWPFNEESVARAIFRSQIPVISAVGHETDFTIADFVADLRAPTPSAAAELAVPVKEELLFAVDDERHKLVRAMNNLLEHRRLTLAELKGRLKSPRQILEGCLMRLDHLREKLMWLVRNKIAMTTERLKTLTQKLEALSPFAILERGYAVVMKSGSKKPLTTPAPLKKWDELDIRLARGRLTAAVLRKQ